MYLFYLVYIHRMYNVIFVIWHLWWIDRLLERFWLQMKYDIKKVYYYLSALRKSTENNLHWWKHSAKLTAAKFM